MDTAKNLVDLMEDALRILQLLVDFAENHPVLAAIVLTVLILILLLQSGQTARSIFKWIRGARWHWVVGAVLGVLLLFVLSWNLLHKLVESQRPNPVHLEPSVREVIWGRRVLLKWESPGSELVWNQFDVEIHQGNKTEMYKAYRNQYPFSPLDQGFEEGSFEWRVRSSDPESNWSRRQRTTFYKDRLARISKERTLRVGLFADELPPFAFFSKSEPDHVDGIEVRVARILTKELAKLQGWPADLRVDFVRSEWLRGNIDDLKSGKVDLVMANTSRSKEREETYNILFSTPYLMTRLAFVWKKLQSVSSWTELADKKVAIWEGSTAHMVLSTFNAAPRNYRSTSRMFEALSKGEIHAILDDEYVMRSEVQKAAANEYEIQVFLPPEKLALSFNYPEEIAAYVSNDGSSTALLENINLVLGRPMVKKRIEEIMELFTKAP